MKLCREVEAAVKKVAEEQGLSKDIVQTCVSDCWNHMMNVWFSGVSTELSEYIYLITWKSMI